MKATIKAGLVTTLLLASGMAQADWSANVGFMSEYYFRGIYQKTSSANGGFDYEAGNFSIGTWAADVGDGLEVDGYFSYGFDLGAVSLSAGYTGYFYTGDFDDTYQEINLGAGAGIFSLDVAVGKYDNFGGPKLDYTYYSLKAEHNGFYAQFAGFTQDFDGEYLELGWGTTVSELDIGVYLLFNSEELAGDVNDDGEDESDINLIFTISKSFDL